MDVRDDAGAHDRRGTVAKTAVAVGLAAVWIAAAALLWRTRVPDDLALPHLDPRDYFPADHLARARRHATVPRALFLATVAVQIAVVAVFAWKGRALAARLRPATRGTVRTGVAVGVVCIVAVRIATLPLGVTGHWWARRYGLSHQAYGGWLTDWLAAAGFRLALYAAAITGVVWLAVRFGRRWWIVASPLLVGLGVLFVLLQPLVVQPLFGHYEPLPDARLAADVQRLADRMGVHVSTVQVSDASRRTTIPNANVWGIGPTRRVVFDDTILDGRFGEDEILSVTAHELAHVERRHIWKGLAWFALFAVPGLALVAWVTERRGGLREPGLVPLGLLAALLFFLATLPATNAVSRRYEAEADWLALEATRDPDAAIELERRLALASIGGPRPPFWSHVLLATHPTTMDRIAMAEAFRERARP